MAVDNKVLDRIRKETIVDDYLRFCGEKYKNAFTAIAELADNAHDADANNFSIDYYKSNDDECLEFLDDGCGMSREEALDVITYNRISRKRPGKIGRYGHALISATSKIGKVFMMFTKQTKIDDDGLKKVSYTVLMVSHEFHYEQDLRDTIYAPCLSYDQNFNLIESDDVEAQNLQYTIMAEYGIVPMAEMRKMLMKIRSPNGTLILIGELTKLGDCELGLNFWKDPHDILQDDADNRIDGSLREFLKWLYLDARMKIRLRDEDIYPKKVCENWAARFHINFCMQKCWGDPTKLEHVAVYCGLEVENRENDGIHFYINNRLVLFGYKDMEFFKENEKTVGFTAYVNLNADSFPPAENKEGLGVTADFRVLAEHCEGALIKYYEYVMKYWVPYRYYKEEYGDWDGEELIEPFWNSIGYVEAFDRESPRDPLTPEAAKWKLDECGVWIVCCKCRQWKRDHLKPDPYIKKEKLRCRQFHYGPSKCHSAISDHERFDITLKDWRMKRKFLAIKKEREEDPEMEEEEVEEEEEQEEEEQDERARPRKRVGRNYVSEDDEEDLEEEEEEELEEEEVEVVGEENEGVRPESGMEEEQEVQLEEEALLTDEEVIRLLTKEARKTRRREETDEDSGVEKKRNKLNHQEEENLEAEEDETNGEGEGHERSISPEL